jgi:hypothetical protein
MKDGINASTCWPTTHTKMAVSEDGEPPEPSTDAFNGDISEEDSGALLESRLPSSSSRVQQQPASLTPAQLLQHPDFIDFSAEDFDANSYASSVVHAPSSAYYAAGGDISASLAKLAYNVEHLRKQVRNCHWRH